MTKVVSSSFEFGSIGDTILRGVLIWVLAYVYGFYGPAVALAGGYTLPWYQMTEGFFRAWPPFMVIMLCADIASRRLAAQSATRGIVVVFGGLLVALLIATFLGAESQGRSILLLGTLPGLVFGHFRRFFFLRTEFYSGDDVAQVQKGESWSILKSTRKIEGNWDFFDKGIGRPDSHTWQWWYQAEMQVSSGFYGTVFISRVITEITNNGLFRVTREAAFCYVCGKKPEEKGGHLMPDEIVSIRGIDTGVRVVLLECPADDVRRFMVGLASDIELSSTDQAVFRAGKLLFTDHNLIRVELADARVVTIGRDFYHGRNYTENIILQITSRFKRPPNGWASFLSGAPAAVGGSSPDYDPI